MPARAPSCTAASSATPTARPPIAMRSAPDDVVPARALALTTFASTLALVSDLLALGIEDAANEIKHRFVPPAS